MRDEKLHAVVARSTFPSQNVQNTPGADHFCQLRCRKSARRCGAKHISKSKCTKHTSSGPLLAVEMLKNCTPLARSTFPSQNAQNTPGADHFWQLRCRKSARRCGAKHISKSKCTKHTSSGPLLEAQMSFRFTTLYYTTLRYTTLHYTTLHYTTLHYLPLHFTTLHYTPLHYNYTTTLHYTPLHSITLHYTKLHYTTLHYTTFHYTPLHYTTLRHTTFHYTPLHYITPHYITLNDTAPQIDR